MPERKYPWRDRLAYAVNLAATLPACLRRRTLALADPTPTFGSVREMYAANVYLRAFLAALTRSGFHVLTTDQHRARTGPQCPHYLYASRTGDLVPRP